MPKMSTEAGQPVRRALSGPTMGTRWSVVLFAPESADLVPLQAALQAAVDEVDAQMSTWKPQSDLMRFNAAPLDTWVALPERLMAVLARSLEIGRLSGGAFEIALGDAVAAWGFGPAPADVAAIRAARARVRRPSYELLELDLAGLAARKTAPLTLDLSGIAKGYGVDCLVEVLRAQGVTAALATIDGELRAIGSPPGRPGWAVAIERPDPGIRAAQSVLEIHDLAVATSGDYRHWVEVGGRRLSHTMDPATGAPLLAPPASVTVLAETCIAADALASACMVLGEEAGRALAARLGVEVLFLARQATGSAA